MRDQDRGALLQSLKVGPGTPHLRFKSGTLGPLSKFKSGTPDWDFTIL